MVIERQSENDFLKSAQTREAISQFFAQNDYTGKRILAIVPDNTRSGPVGEVFKLIFGCLEGKAEALDVLIALGTHQPMTEEQICARLDISVDERN
ncbi:MAG: lactate racemase domain-containing protein, partial [Planctomycetota bacterium]